jgi:hypothetical protein
MVLMRSAWVLAMLAVTVLALLPIEHLQLPVFDCKRPAVPSCFSIPACHNRYVST